jgi:hypothetical protein
MPLVLCYTDISCSPPDWWLHPNSVIVLYVTTEVSMLQALEDEMKARRNKSEQLCAVGFQLIFDKHPSSPEIQSRIDSLREQRNTLQELAALRRKQLEDAAEAYQVCV